VDTHVKNLRKKIERDPADPMYVETVYGVGYRFAEQ
jgi:DNA-binding response OmpR family regulator